MKTEDDTTRGAVDLYSLARRFTCPYPLEKMGTIYTTTLKSGTQIETSDLSSKWEMDNIYLLRLKS